MTNNITITYAVTFLSGVEKFSLWVHVESSDEDAPASYAQQSGYFDAIPGAHVFGFKLAVNAARNAGSDLQRAMLFAGARNVALVEGEHDLRDI